jgi:hypothetical protein
VAITKTLFKEFPVAGALTNAYNVTLASSDGTYGIKNKLTGIAIVSNGTPVSNPSTGRYEYTVTLDPNTAYEVSWRFLSSPAVDPTFIVEDVGPFSEPDSPIRAVADRRGSFIQSTIGTLFLRVTSIEDMGIDPSQIILSITDSAGVPVRDNLGKLIDRVSAEKISDGFYFFDWEIPLTQPAGDYTVTWTYQTRQRKVNEFQTITVSAATETNPQSLYSGVLNEFRQVLSNMLSIAQSVVVQNEPSRRHDDAYATYYFTFPRWNQSSRVQIYVNRAPVNSNITINYFKGSVTFDTPLTPYDVVEADYDFRWFSDEELDTFLSNGIGRYNTTPPFTRQDWHNLPPDWYETVLNIAASHALRNLMMRLLTMEAKLVFGGPEAARELFGNLDTIKKNYEEQAKEQLDKKKLGPYAGLTRIISVPAYTLPGGRSRWFRSLFSGGGN